MVVEKSKRLSRLLIMFVLFSSLVACKPTASAGENDQEIPPTPTYELPQPETALKNALERFDLYQSYTIHTFMDYESGEYGSTTITESVRNMDRVNEVNLLDSESTSQINPKYQRFCVKENCYKTDATGLYKPSTGKFSLSKPSLDFLEMEVNDILDSDYTYLGEESLGERNTFKYELTATDEQMQNSDLKLAMPLPQIYFYVDAESGDLLKIYYSYHKTFGTAVDSYELNVEYSDWNTTTIVIPEYVDAQNTEWQPYNGAYASAVSFEFPKVYFLTEYYGYPSLKTPTGSQMDLTIYETIALLSDDQYSNLCPDIFNEFVLAFDNTSPTLDRAEWIQTDAFNFCKGIINAANGQRVEYLFNEPMDVAGRSGRLLPETFRIIIYPAEGDDANTIFWDVIQTIRIGGEE